MLPLYLQQAFSHPGDALLASPVLRSKIPAVTFRRRFNSYMFGITEASLLRHEITPILVFPVPFLMAVVSIASDFLSRACLVVLLIPKLLPRPLVGLASVGPWERLM